MFRDLTLQKKSRGRRESSSTLAHICRFDQSNRLEQIHFRPGFYTTTSPSSLSFLSFHTVLSIPKDCQDMRLSGLQREVLKLYRKCLREANKKPQVIARLDWPIKWLT